MLLSVETGGSKAPFVRISAPVAILVPAKPVTVRRTARRNTLKLMEGYKAVHVIAKHFYSQANKASFPGLDELFQGKLSSTLRRVRPSTSTPEVDVGANLFVEFACYVGIEPLTACSEAL